MRFHTSILPARALGLTFTLASGMSTAAYAQTVVDWAQPVDGTWNDASNWSGSVVPNNGQPNPGDTYHAVINQSGDNPYTVTLSDNLTLDGLTLDAANATLYHEDSTLTLNGTMRLLNGTYTLWRSDIYGGTIDQAGSQVDFRLGTLDNVQLLGDFNMTSPEGGRMVIQNGTTISGDINIGGQFQRLIINDNVVLNNTINIDGYDVYIHGSEESESITLGPDAIVNISGDYAGFNSRVTGHETVYTNHGVVNVSGTNHQFGGMYTYNHGTINLANDSDMFLKGSVALGTTNFPQGTINVGENAHMQIAGDWNGQTIHVNGGILDLYGTFQIESFGNIIQNGGVTWLSGSWGNQERTIEINETTGDLLLNGGEIRGGTINIADGMALRFTNEGGFLRENVTINGNVLFDDNHGTIYFGNGTHFTGQAEFTGNHNLLLLDAPSVTALNNSFLFSGNSNTLSLRSDGSTVFTEDAKMVFTGSGNTIVTEEAYTENETVTNQGSIEAHGNEQGHTNTYIQTHRFINEGTIEAFENANIVLMSDANTNNGLVQAHAGSYISAGVKNKTFTNGEAGQISANGATLAMRGDWSNQGIIDVTDTLLILDGQFTTQGMGTINRQGGQVYLAGQVDNTSGAWSLTPSLGQIVLRGGSITGGSLDQSGGLLEYSMFGGQLNNVAYNGSIDLGGFMHRVTLGQGTTFSGNANLAGEHSRLTINQTGSFDNTFALTGKQARLSVGANQTFTLGANGTIAMQGEDTRIDSGTNGLFVNRGQVLVQTDALINAHAFTNHGQITIGPDNTLLINSNVFESASGSSYTLDQGTLAINNGTGTLVIEQDSQLSGTGVIDGSLISHGEIKPGMSAGQLLVTQDLSLGETSTLFIELGGTEAGSDHDVLTVLDGTATLDGLLNISLLDGYTPNSDDTFDILWASSVEGSFSNLLDGQTIQVLNGGQFTLNLFDTHVQLAQYDASAIVPEPTTLVPALIGMVWFAGRRRRAS